MEEILELVNINNNPIGEIKRADLDRSHGTIVRTVALLLLNDKNQVLMQQRSSKKATFPLAWSTLACTGHVPKGETLEEAVKREAFEELGITLTPKFFKKQFNPNEGNHSVFRYIYYSYFDGNQEVKFDDNEIEQVRWIDINELIQTYEEYKLAKSKIDDLQELIKFAHS